MSNEQTAEIREICAQYDRSPGRMMDIALAVQKRFGCVSPAAMETIASETGAAYVEVESVVTFYAFLSMEPKGKIVIRLCDDIIDRMAGVGEVAKAFEDALGVKVGETTADGQFTLEYTPCIGMSDQAPAALVDDVVVTELNAESARKIVSTLKADPDPRKLVTRHGDGNNAHELVQAMVENNIRRRGEIVFADMQPGEGLKKALAMSPVEVINDIKTSRLRGRGGAGFPTGMKWEFTRNAGGDERYVLCNADEGEPGTFKDRVVLTECPDLLFEGMTIAGYAIGAETGILYLRAEYSYLRAFLEKVLEDRRAKNLLGRGVCGKDGFDFDIRIQMGAGAYVCGEETALISSCEGLRGDPKNRPPFPAQRGYLHKPTTVNNVETFCAVARALDKGAGWFAETGSKGSSGSKLLSISGDCKSPGVYEVPFGAKLSEVLKMAGADNAAAVQMGGPSGQLVPQSDFERTICYDDLATGGSVMVFGPDRDLLEVAHYFMEFFIEESCGYCTPCRVGNVLLKERLETIMEGKGAPDDLDYLRRLGKTVKSTSRCGLGQTSPNPILTTLEHFPDLYKRKIKEPEGEFLPRFDLAEAVTQAEAIAGHKSTVASH